METMTKAQIVRKARLMMVNQSITAEAEKIFDWILDLIDSDTQKKYFGPVELYLFNDQTKLKTGALDGTEYDLTELLLIYNKNQLFSSLKNVVEREDGFKAIIKNATFWNQKASYIKITIE